MIIVAEYIWLKIANWMKMETKKFKLVIRMGIGMKKIGGIIRRNGSHMMIIRGKKKRSIGNKVMNFMKRSNQSPKRKLNLSLCSHVLQLLPKRLLRQLMLY